MSQEMSEHNVQSDSSREAMKVTLLGDGWTSSTGGLATLNRELAIQLSQHPQVDVCLLVPDGHCSDEDKSEAKKHGITVVGAKKRPGYDEPLDWLGAPPEGHKMDVVVGHGANLGRQVQFIKHSPRFDNCKWVQVVHTAPEDLSKYKGYSDRISKGEKKHEVEVELCKLADLIVPVGPRLEEVYSSCLQRYKRDTCIFPVIPGLFDREFGGLEQSPNGNGEFKVLLCGRADEEDFELKGYNLAAEAFTDDRLKRKRYSLLFVGAPEGKQEVVRERFLHCGIAEEQLTVKTFVKSREKMKDLLCEVDLAIMPSKAEGFGLVALEALSAGLPILVNSKSGFARALEELPCSDFFIVNSDEPAKWAEAIEGVHKRHRNRLQEITLLRTSYDKRYSWKEQCGNFVEKLRTIVHGSSTGSVKIPIADRPIQEQSAAAAVAPDKGLSGQQPSSDEEKKVFGVNEENETSGVQSRSLQKERKQKTSRSTFDLDIRLTIGIKINPEGLNGEQRREFEEFLLQRWQRFKDNNDISSAEGMGELIEHLTASRGLFLKEIKKGCLEITVVCPTLESLERLWNDYRCGQLNEILEKYLVTDEIKEKLNLENVTLQTTIPEEDYIKAKTSFMKISDMSNIQKGKQRPRSKANGRKQRITYEDPRKIGANEDYEFVAVPEYSVGYVIGRKGSAIKQIQEQSGARISQTKSQNEPVGFIVRGNKEERTCAKELINAKMAEVHPQTNREYISPGQVVKVPRQFKMVVNGPRGDNLRNVSTLSGADVTGDGGHALYLTGAKKKVQHAEYLLRSKVASVRVRSNRIRVYIDERNLPEDCELQLVPLEGKDKMILAGARSQYRLKPADGYDLGPQGASKPHNSYDDSVRKEVLSSLREIKEEIDSGNYHKADFWCHFGKLVIRDLDEADVEEIWTITEAAKKLQAREKKRNEWFVAFKEGVDLNHEVIKETFGEKIEEDFMTRYDLSFISPRSQAIRCKVWVARKGIQKNLEDIPIPFSDVKNVVEELRFEDEATRERCRGWLVLQSKKFLQANIVFPGCEVDCRISIRALTDDVVAKANGVHEKEETHLFAGYLSKLRFTDDDRLILPSDDLPQGYLYNHWRRSHRTLYTPRVGFSMIVSKERSWSRDYNEAETRETTDIHLHSEEWDLLLSGKDWDPEIIMAKLPEFLEFVRDVHVFICDSSKNEHACSET